MYGIPYRGFESLSLRQILRIAVTSERSLAHSLRPLATLGGDSGFRLQAPVATLLTPAKRLKFESLSLRQIFADSGDQREVPRPLATPTCYAHSLRPLATPTRYARGGLGISPAGSLLKILAKRRPTCKTQRPAWVERSSLIFACEPGEPLRAASEATDLIDRRCLISLTGQKGG